MDPTSRPDENDFPSPLQITARTEGVEETLLAEWGGALGEITPHLFEKTEGESRRRILLAQHFAGKRHLEFGGIGAGDCGPMVVDPVNLRAPLAQLRQMRAGRR